MFSLMSLLVHVLREAFSPFMIASARFAVNLVAALIAIHVSKPEHGLWGPPVQRWRLLGRAVLGSAAMSLVFVAMTQLPLGDANAIVFTNPIITSCLAAIVLKERFTTLEALAIPFGFIGVVLVVQPTFIFGEPAAGSGSSQDIATLFKLPYEAAVACAIGSAFLAACAYLCVRALAAPGRPKVESAVVVGWFALAGLVIAPAGALISGEGFQAPQNAWQAVALIAVGLLGYGGQWLLNKGLMMEKAGPASAMRNIDVVLSFAFQAALGEGVSWLSVCGAAIICGATLLVAWSKMRSAPDGGQLPAGGHDRLPAQGNELEEEAEEESAPADSGLADSSLVEDPSDRHDSRGVELAGIAQAERDDGSLADDDQDSLTDDDAALMRHAA
jgi:drug/metabolite transporter (DMT)-like permease